MTLLISLVTAPLRCLLDKVASRSLWNRCPGQARPPANPSPLIAADASLPAAVGDSWCLPGGSNVCLSWWFATHRDSISRNISASMGWTEMHMNSPPSPRPHLAADANCSQKHCREAAMPVTEMLRYWFRSLCKYLQETSADGEQLKMRGNTGSLTGITGPLGCRASYFHTNNLIFGFLPNT